MEWLTKILATVEGADKLAEQIQKEIGKNFVVKSDFNAKNDEIKTLNTEIDGLKKSVQAGGEATAKLAELQAKYDKDTGDLKGQITQIKSDFVIDAEIAKTGARNGKAVRALLDFTKVTVGEDGKVEGLEDQIKALRTSDAYLFGTVGRQGTPPKVGDPAPNGEENLGEQIAKKMTTNVPQNQLNSIWGISNNSKE